MTGLRLIFAFFHIYGINRFSHDDAPGVQVGRCIIYLKVQFIENIFQTCLVCWHKF